MWYIVSYLVELFRYGHWGVTTCVRWSSLSWVEMSWVRPKLMWTQSKTILAAQIKVWFYTKVLDLFERKIKWPTVSWKNKSPCNSNSPHILTARSLQEAYQSVSVVNECIKFNTTENKPQGGQKPTNNKKSNTNKNKSDTTKTINTVTWQLTSQAQDDLLFNFGQNLLAYR